MSVKWLLVAAGAIVLGASVGVVSLLVQEYDLLPASEQQASEESTAAEAEPIRLTGVVVPRNVVGVPAPVEGSLQSVAVNIGEQVYEGQLLGHILNTAFLSEIDAAREDIQELDDMVYNLENKLLDVRKAATEADGQALAARETYQEAEREYLRSQNLLARGATPRMAHEKVGADYLTKQSRYETLNELAVAADARLKGAEAQLDLARKQLDDAEAYEEAVASKLTAADVISPTDGVFAGMSARPGEEVHPEAGDLFAIATDLFQLAVILEPEPAVAEHLHQGQRAIVQIPELPAGWVEGEVVFDNNQVEVHFVSPTTAVVPGSTAQVVIPLA